jgi:hypothetical protein
VSSRIEVIHEPALVASPRYAADHNGAPFQRSAADEETSSMFANILSPP